MVPDIGETYENDFILAEEANPWNKSFLQSECVSVEKNLVCQSVQAKILTDRQAKSQPVSLNLESNYPNPFNPETNIVYTLAHKDVVTVTVYDIQGALVSTLVKNEIQPAGRIALRFDASNLSSGVYFYKIQTSNAVKTAKMILVR